MYKIIAKLAPVFFVAMVGLLFHDRLGSPSAHRAIAQESPQIILDRIEKYTQQGKENSINQITNVNQLRDVSPTDWSYEALRSLSDRYGCISGFPDGTYKGDRPITRNEFAAGLNSCFEQIERSISNHDGQFKGF